MEAADDKKESTSSGDPPVFRVVLTGGPCGGKTTSLAIISERFQALGWRVFSVPEAASILLGGGINFYNLTADQVYNFQSNLLHVMIALENSFVDIAKKTGQKSLVICDRGAMDCSAYIGSELWQAILDENNFTSVGLRDSRYDCVIHLVTAADGAPDFYVTDTVRTESPKQAMTLDRKIQDAWIGHPYLSIIDNSTNFSEKIEHVVNALCQFTGETVPISSVTKRKFLVRNCPDEFPIKFQDYDVQHNYLLTADNTQARLRKRGQFGTYVYSHTIRWPEHHGQSLQLRRNLSGREYMHLRESQSDPRRNAVTKKRRSFIYKNQYYELDTYISCKAGLMLLEAYIPASVNVKLPPFLEIVREVTKEKEYSMYNLALKEQRKSIGELMAEKYRGRDSALLVRDSSEESGMVDTAGHFGVK